ncbi:bacteriocin-type signal sequence [Treponema sp. OMZ 799]|uniref:bacteriocin-type signal sequence n=1 Tax=Treponema sp. OMZ 799 TaxID=2563668 RepID=UPI0020A3DB2B|nr:bacteriocin-type signal sequence [Treponema sp. OMZ 799]
MKKIIKLMDEDLLLVRGGTDKKKYNSVGEIIRRTNLKYAQDVVREAAIYRPHAKGNFDYEGAAEDVTWCNQSSYDVMEATGVHMEAFYGEPDGYQGTKGQRGAGYWVNANTACKNGENYIANHAKEQADARMKEIGFKPITIDEEFKKTHTADELYLAEQNNHTYKCR